MRSTVVRVVHSADRSADTAKIRTVKHFAIDVQTADASNWLDYFGAARTAECRQMASFARRAHGWRLSITLKIGLEMRPSINCRDWLTADGNFILREAN